MNGIRNHPHWLTFTGWLAITGAVVGVVLLVACVVVGAAILLTLIAEAVT